MTDKPTSALVVPIDVVQMYNNLRPELRRKLSMRDLDEMRKPYTARIRELEQERDEMKAALIKIAVWPREGDLKRFARELLNKWRSDDE